jgi:hypothetical protein
MTSIEPPISSAKKNVLSTTGISIKNSKDKRNMSENILKDHATIYSSIF